MHCKFSLLSMFVTGLFFGSSLIASPLQDNDTSYFDQLVELYNVGENITDEALLNYRVGRCFKKESPSDPEAAALHVKRELEDVDVGPIGDDKYVYRGAAIWKTSGAANHFDNLELANLQNEFKANNYFLGQYTDDAFKLNLGSSGASYGLFRVSGDYVIELDYRPAGENLVENNIVCYYFKVLN